MKKFCIIFLLLLFSATLFADDDDKIKLAVMEFEDLSGKIEENILTNATEYPPHFHIERAKTERHAGRSLRKGSGSGCSLGLRQLSKHKEISAEVLFYAHKRRIS